MSQGIRAALNKLDDMIENAVPKTDQYHGFVSINSREGSINLIDDTTSNTRFFDIRTSSFGQDGGLSGLSGNKTGFFEVVIRYDIPRNPQDRLLIMAEDAANIINTIKGPDYDLPVTGIINCVVDVSPTTTPILDDDGDEVASLLIVPFTMIYLES